MASSYQTTEIGTTGHYSLASCTLRRFKKLHLKRLTVLVMLYKLHEAIVLRTPKHSISQAPEEVLHSASFKELIFTTSPTLYAAHFTKEEGSKNTIGVLHKFFLRSKYRATPFGLLAGTFPGQLGRHLSYSTRRAFSLYPTRLSFSVQPR